MLRLDNIPPEEMPEVVRVASELYEKDREREAEAAERQATVQAAAEVGLPEEYLHRAAAELHARRVEQVKQRRRRRNGLLAVGGAVLALGTAAIVDSQLRQSAPTPTSITQPARSGLVLSSPFSPTHWNLNSNSGTQATVTFQNDTAVIHVDRFAPDAKNQYFANLNTLDGPKNLAGYRTASVWVKGSLPQVRLYLENGNERWRSLPIPVEGQERLVRLDLNDFEYQTRPDRNATWQKESYKPPETVETMSFKTGWFVNDANASGEVSLRDLRFE